MRGNSYQLNNYTVQQSINNSIVLFAPNIDTLHAIKMQYDHNKFQRTQLYGNLMGVGGIVPQMNWKELKAIRDAR